MGVRRAWDDEAAGVSDGVAVRPSRRTEGCWDEACCSFPAGPVEALAAGDGERRGRPPTGTVKGDVGGKSSPTLGASPTSVSHGHDGRSRANSGRKILTHPYMAHQMSGSGFQQTLEVRTLRCTRRSSPYQLTPRSLSKDLG